MKLRVTVEGKAYDVDVEILEDSGAAAGAPAPAYAPSRPPVAAAPAAMASAPAAAPVAAGAGVFPSPLAGTIRGIKVKPGDTVAANQEIIILEAMKMETAVSAPHAGTIKTVLVNVGDAVLTGQPLVEFA